LQYKFIVDGEWKYDPNQPAMFDEMGNVNNMIEVRQWGSQTLCLLQDLACTLVLDLAMWIGSAKATLDPGCRCTMKLVMMQIYGPTNTDCVCTGARVCARESGQPQWF
jgi:hypothetical protein